MATAIVTTDWPGTHPAPDADGPFGDKPEEVCAAFWADPVFAVRQILIRHDERCDPADPWSCEEDTVRIIGDAMFGQSRHEQCWEDEIADQNYSARYWIMALADPFNGPVLARRGPHVVAAGEVA